ncbi:hypothetical protein C0J52_19948 [Blattella germanica]|nr:hypothetical protein C0J52_19948 [Blattella germanica]
MNVGQLARHNIVSTSEEHTVMEVAANVFLSLEAKAYSYWHTKLTTTAWTMDEVTNLISMHVLTLSFSHLLDVNTIPFLFSY